MKNQPKDFEERTLLQPPIPNKDFRAPAAFALFFFVMASVFFLFSIKTGVWGGSGDLLELFAGLLCCLLGFICSKQVAKRLGIGP